MNFSRQTVSLFLVSLFAVNSIVFLVSLHQYNGHQNVAYAQITPTGTNSSSVLNEVDAPISHKYSSSGDNGDGDYPGSIDGTIKDAANETQGVEDGFPLKEIGHQGSLLEEIFDNVTQDLNESGIWDMGF